MKNILITLGGLSIVIVIGFWYQNSQQEIGWSRGETEVIEKTVEVHPDWAQDEDAVKAAQAVIRKKELETELKSLDAQIKELQTRRKSVTDELTTY